MYTSVSKILAFGLLVSAPLANALAIPSQSQDLARSVDSLEARHHTEAQIAVSFLLHRHEFRTILTSNRRRRPRPARVLVTLSSRPATTPKHKSQLRRLRRARLVVMSRSVIPITPRHRQAHIFSLHFVELVHSRLFQRVAVHMIPPSLNSTNTNTAFC
jgi:hypothetical protein